MCGQRTLIVGPADVTDGLVHLLDTCGQVADSALVDGLLLQESVDRGLRYIVRLRLRSEV